MKSRRARSGFALLLTLFLIVMVGIAITGLARRSMRGALEAQDATEELQRRWALRSLRAATLPRLPILLELAEKTRATRQRAVSLPEFRLACRLSGVDYEIVLTDEQAKLDMNHLLRQTNPQNVQTLIKRLLPRTSDSSAGAHVHLRPQVRQNNSQSLPPFGAFGQLFDRASPQDLLGTPQQPGLVSRITCWGDGRINIHRASPEILECVCEPILMREQIRHLIRRREDDPSRKFSELLDGLPRIDDNSKAQLSTLFTDESRTFGLWIVARNAQRAWHTFSVAEYSKKHAEANLGRKPVPEYQWTRKQEFSW